MASSSSSGVMASACSIRSSYDVFLSFRGEDTRHSFTDHLYEKLNRAGIYTFRDEEINRGEELMSEIKTAIKASKASIVVLSENYARSTWCLDELVLILEQRRECNHFVLPVFYHVEPTDVRKQKNTFAIEVKTSSRWTDQNVNTWKAALMQVADLSGMVLSGSETKFMKEIINNMYNKLDRKEIHLPRNIIGMETREKEISYWLKQSDVEVLAICGMGGSGKTTLARYIVHSNWQTFENISIIEDISRRCKEQEEILKMQEKLIGDILGGKRRKLPSVCQGTFKIEEALLAKKALIVLDDITELQLETLLGTGSINEHSKIILTTRENNLDNWFKSRSWRFHKCEMQLLNDCESMELLSCHAFGSKTPTEGFEELAMQAVKYCEGNPLALELLGSSLFQNNTITHWKSRLKSLEKDIDSRLERVLLSSYKSLPYLSEKELFLHISCFFVGADMEYVIKILESDYYALSGIKTLTNRYLLSVSINKKLMMHRLVQEMGRNIVRKESLKYPLKRSRVWLSNDSYKILSNKEGSKTIEGLALDMHTLKEENFAFKSSGLKTDSLENMKNLKLLQLNFVELEGSYSKFSENLRWLCWLGFHLRTIPSDMYMGNLVAIDMSYSRLEAFEPPTVLQSLEILNLKDSHNLVEIRNIFRIPNLETLILWNCYSLAFVCETIGGLKSLAMLNMTGCEKLFHSELKHKLVEPIIAFNSPGDKIQILSFPLPNSLQRLFLDDCNLQYTDSFPLSFGDKPFLQYLNLAHNLFDFLSCYKHLENLRVLDLSFCSKLNWLIGLPSTLAELYIYYCKSLKEITFESHRFTLQEFGYEGCTNLAKVEGFIKLLPIAKLDDKDLGHLKWLKEYDYLEVCLVGDVQLTAGRSRHIQMLYEFNIMSTSLRDIEDSNMNADYASESSVLSFDVPSCPKNKSLKGLDVSFKYTIAGDDWVWFCKITTTSGVDLMYNPIVFGKPKVGEVGIWLSYWPIGNKLKVGDKVKISIAVMSAMEVHECRVSLVYTDDEVGTKSMESYMGREELPCGNLSEFQLSTGAYYLCRHDFYDFMEVGRLNPDWFRILVGDTIDYSEVRGWRKTGRPKQLSPSFTELKTIRCIIHGPELEEIYKIAQSSFADKRVAFESSVLKETKKSGDPSEGYAMIH